MNTINKGFHFEEKGHKYTFDGKPMSGVTTILGVISKPMLLPWAARIAVEYIDKELTDQFKQGYKSGNFDMRGVDWESIFEKAKVAWRTKRDTAAESGTDVHAEIEIMIKESIERKQMTYGSESSEQAKHFFHWVAKNNVKFLESEKKVYSKELWCAGTYDFKCEMDGKIYLSDIKTSSGIYDRTPFAQCAAYQRFEEEMNGIKFSYKDGEIVKTYHSDESYKYKEASGRLIINLKKTGIFNEEKDVYFSYDYDTDLSIFLSALKIYRGMATFKKQSWK